MPNKPLNQAIGLLERETAYCINVLQDTLDRTRRRSIQETITQYERAIDLLAGTTDLDRDKIRRHAIAILKLAERE